LIDLDDLLTPIEGEHPAGENLRYTPVYDAIQEARREDDDLDRGDWDREVKTADWEAVRRLFVEALTEKTKDIQIAVWLLESLIKIDGFRGLDQGMRFLSGLLEAFWDHLYPEIEDDDLDYRIGPLEFMNDKLWLAVKQVPLTDPAGSGGGYSWVKWKEATDVGTDEAAIAEGKLGIEDFESAVNRSTKSFYSELNSQIENCIAAFTDFDNLLDDKFGSEAPRTADFKQALEDCQRFVAKTLKQKKELDPDPEPDQGAGESLDDGDAGLQDPTGHEPDTSVSAASPVTAAAATVQGQIVVGMISDTEPHENVLWNNALTALKKDGIKKALDILFSASCSVSSVRSKNRYRLLMAKLCLQADRTDLARPIAEELNTLVEELGLERWESPVWVADVLGALYRCLIQEEEGSDDYYRAEEIFKKMCTIDLTKALRHRR
jgi:type VI secretion system protein ImpA